MASIISPSVNPDESPTFVLSGTTTTLSLYGTNRPLGSASIQRQAGSNFYEFGKLTNGQPVMNLTGTGTFKVVKDPSVNATGVDRD